MRSTLITCILLQVAVMAFAQPSKNTRLGDILPMIEARHGVSFSYKSSLIAGKRVDTTGVMRILSTDSLLKFLEGSVGLRFEKIKGSDKYVVISAFRATDPVTVYGRVLGANQSPLIGAAIYTDLRKGTISDIEGRFRLEEVPYDQQITISHLGYEPLVLFAYELLQPLHTPVRLKVGARVLEEFVVMDYTTKGIDKQDNTLIINTKRLNLLPGWVEPDIMQALQLSPGVSAPLESSSNLYVRGGTPDQNLVLWNGIKTYDQSHFFGAISAFNPVIPQRVAFSKSGTNPMYGDRIGGIIDIKTDAPMPKKVGGSAGINLLSADLFLETPIIKDTLSFNVSGRRSFSDIIETPTFLRFADRAFQNTKILASDTSRTTRDSQFFFSDLSTSVLFQPTDKNTFRFNGLLTENKLNFTSTSVANSFHDLLRTGSEGFNLSWTGKLKAGRSFSISPYFLRYGLYYQFAALDTEGEAYSTKENLIREKGLRTSLLVSSDTNHALEVGYQYSDNRIGYAFREEADGVSLLLDSDDQRLHAHSLFGYFQKKWRGLSLDLGSRVNYLSGWDRWILEPRVQVSYAYPRVSVGTSYEYRTQTVSQIRESVVSDLSLENKVWTLSSQDRFPLITSHQVSGELGLHYNGWLVETDLYWRLVEGITSLTFGFLNPNPENNEYRVGEAKIKGLDILVRKRIGGYSGVMAYSYIDTQNRFDQFFDNQPFPGNWNIKHLLKFNHFYNWGHFSFSASWTWHSGKVFTAPESVIEEGGTPLIRVENINKEVLPDYHRLDLSVSYKIHTKGSVKYLLGASVLNVYNQRNLINHELRRSPGIGGDLLSSTFYGLPITPNLVFRASW